MFRIALVGTGKIAGTHIRAIKELGDIELAALCDVNEEVVKPLAEENCVPYFLNYKDIPGKVECDAVLINLPHFLHCESTVFFLENGYNVLLEKPMANTVEECDRMIAAAKKSGKKLAIAHVMRYINSTRAIKKVIDSGELGRLVMVSDHRSEDYFAPSRPKWFLDKKLAGGGVTMNFGAHFFDKMCYLLGRYPNEVSALASNFANDCTIEGHAQIFAKFGDVSATFAVSGYHYIPQESYYIFTEGAIHVFGAEVYTKKKGEAEWTELSDIEPANAFALQMQDFVDYVSGKPSNIPTAEYGREVISAIEKVFLNLQ